MSCKVINKDLNLFSCNKGDVENEWMDIRTDTYHAGYDIDGLTTFYNPQTDKLIIVKDAEHFEQLKHIAEGYLSLNSEQRNEFNNNNIPKSIEGFMNVLKETVYIREEKIKKETLNKKVQSIRGILIKHNIPYDVLDEIIAIYDGYGQGSKTFGLIDIYNYGVIQGKRTERAKKKRFNGNTISTLHCRKSIELIGG